MNLASKTVPATSLSEGMISEMVRLMQAHYEGVSAEQFRADLAGKHWVILLRDGPRLCGFSTQVLFRLGVMGRDVRVLFSGDTIIDKACWGTLALPLAWGRLMLGLLDEEPETPLYWLLTSKGYKTYKFLPVFFREFHPCVGVPVPEFADAIRTVAARRIGGARYDANRGILHACSPDPQRLRPGVADLEPRRLHDRHVSFFQSVNPGHAHGDELVCLAQFHRQNLSPFILRQL